MLDTLRRGQRWLTGLFVLAVGGVFVFFIGIGQPLQGRSASTIVKVGRYEYDRNDFERLRERREAQIQESVGEGYDARAMRDTLDQLTIQSLVDRGLLSLEAEALGLTVAKQEIERIVRSAGIFRGEDGRFDREAFERYAEYEFGNQHNFIEEQRQGLLATKLVRLLATQARVSDAEAHEVVRRRLEAVQLAIVSLDATSPPAGLEISEEQVQGLLTAREADAKALYEQRLETYDVPEQVRARHILLRVEPGAPAEAVEARRREAEAIHARLVGGEDFASLASSLSEDPGSKESGGDLGFFKRGQMVKPFEDAAFALGPGELSPVFRSDFGFHLLRVEERKPAQLRTFDEVKAELAREILGREAARELARGIADRLAEAIRAGKSLETAAREAKLTLDRTGRLQRRPDGYVPGLGAAQDLLALAFTLPAGASSPQIFEVGGKLALIQVLERAEPAAEEIAAAAAAERSQLLEQKRRELSDTWLARTAQPARQPRAAQREPRSARRARVLRRSGERFLLVPDQLHELGARLGVALEGAAHRAGDGEGVLLGDPAHHHAQVDRLDHHRDALGLEHALERLRDLRGETLLHLQAPAEHLDQARDLREPHHLALRQVGDVRAPEERQHVVLAEAVEVDVLHDHHLVVADVEERVVEDLRRDPASSPCRRSASPWPRAPACAAGRRGRGPRRSPSAAARSGARSDPRCVRSFHFSIHEGVSSRLRPRARAPVAPRRRARSRGPARRGSPAPGSPPSARAARRRDPR